MFKIAIIDDELSMQKIAQSIVDSISESKDYKIKYKAYFSSEEFLEDKHNYEFDALILDIELSGMNGLDLARTIKHSHEDIKIIFLTSYQHHMKNAFGLNVHSYVLKEDISSELAKCITELIDLKESKNQNKLEFNTDAGLMDVIEDNIICVMYEDRHPVIYIGNITLVVYGMTLSNVYHLLRKDIFIQPNSGSIINIMHIEKMSNDEVKMINLLNSISISRGKFKQIRELYTQYYMQGDRL